MAFANMTHELGKVPVKVHYAEGAGGIRKVPGGLGDGAFLMKFMAKGADELASGAGARKTKDILLVETCGCGTKDCAAETKHVSAALRERGVEKDRIIEMNWKALIRADSIEKPDVVIANVENIELAVDCIKFLKSMLPDSKIFVISSDLTVSLEVVKSGASEHVISPEALEELWKHI
ncbi:MAG: hypothetical protein Q7T16_04415 [Candidatus Burarchaeum sp.]|nr:hypothetical protein [Candidatus Burarchaeum sp.]MDO8339872.1 hypothetical protein [Candidatus Burarchaeum sp.]